MYHSFQYSDGLLLDFLNVIGVSAHRVRRYKAPPDQFHILYVVDTRGLAEDRARRGAPPYLATVLQALEPEGMSPIGRAPLGPGDRSRRTDRVASSESRRSA